MTDSYVKFGTGGTAFVGPDAVSLYRAVAIRSGLRLYANTGLKPNRAYSPTQMLKAASEYTGKSYKRGEYHRAAEDLQVWIEAMKAAMPVERDA